MTHKKRSVVFSAAALLLTLMVAVTGCTTAIEDTQTTPDAPVPTAAAMPVAAMPEQTPAAASPEPAPAQNDTHSEKTLMATFTIDNSNHNETNRMYNVRKAADMLSGAVIKPGETISLNEILGPRTVSDGWKEAAGISNGAYISEPGGGVCAVSSALYNAAIRAELTIVEMRHHSLVPFYVDIGLDACISNGGPDLKIQNPYDSDVTIEAVLDDMLLTVNIYGPPLGYTVDYRSEEKETGQTPETKYIYNTEITPEGIYIAPGIAMEYLHARPFTSYEVYKTRYDLEGKEIDTTLFQKSSYRAIQGIVYVNGPDPNSESTPPPASDPSS